jgi:hypothetical protein
MDGKKNVVVIGYVMMCLRKRQDIITNMDRAGVAGLTTAFLLSKSRQYKIVVAAKHMPGDYDIEYASPWAVSIAQ